MKARTLAVAGLSVAVLTAGVSRGQTPATPDAQVTETEYRVLSTYIARTFTGKNGEERVVDQVSKIVIADKTHSDKEDPHNVGEDDKPLPWKDISAYLRKKCPALERATLNSFREANIHPARFRPLFRLPVKCELIEKGEFDRTFEKGGWWQDYYKKYPHSQGFLTLSRVGFNQDGDQALFYASNSCGGKCGTGSYVVMQRIGSSWKVLKEVLIWIS